MSVLEGIRKARSAFILDRGMVPNVLRVPHDTEDKLMALTFQEVGELAEKIIVGGRDGVDELYGMQIEWDASDLEVRFDADQGGGFGTLSRM